jgi:hypothetical protein
MRYPGFIGHSYESQSAIAAGERLVNWYPEIIESGGKTQAALYPCPGLVAFADTGESPGRGIFAENDRLFAVQGTRLKEISSAGVVTDRGAVAINDNPVMMTTNGDAGGEMFIIAGGSGYVFNLNTNTLTLEVADVTMGGQIDGFFVALDAASSTLKISESLDGTTWDALQIAQRSAASDPWIAMIVVRREIYLFGEKTGEVWYNAGLSPFPFAQRQGAFFQTGVIAPFSLAPFGDSMAWLGQSAAGSGIVYWMNGYTPNRISNHAVEWAIQQYKADGGIDDAIGWSYENQGHSFYVLTFPTQGKTWVFDATTSRWHERGLWNGQANDYIAYRPRFHAQAYEKNLVCDAQGDVIYELSPTTYTDVDGEGIRRVRRAPHLANENQRSIVHTFEVEADRGVGLVDGQQGDDPQLMLRYSRNGGKTFGTERSRTLGALGAYTTRIKWDRCGQGRDWVFEVSCSDPVPVRLLDAYITVEPCPD